MLYKWYVCVVYVVLVVFQCTPRCTAARIVFQCTPRCTAARTLSGMCVLCMWCWLYFSVFLAVQQLLSGVCVCVCVWCVLCVVCVCVCVCVVLVVFQCTPRCTAAHTQCTPRCTAARTLSGMCVLCVWCWLYFSVLLAVQQLARWVVCVCCVCGAGCISVYSSLYSSSHVSGMCVLCVWCWLYFSVLCVCVCVCVVLVVFQCTPRCTAARTLSGMCVCVCVCGAGCISMYSSLYSSSHVKWYVCCVCGAGCISVYSSLYSSSHVEWYVCVVCVVLVVFQCTPRCTAARTLSGMCVLCVWCWLYFSVPRCTAARTLSGVCVCVCGAGCISVYSSLYSSSHVEWYVCVVCVVLVVFQCTYAVQQLARWVVCVCCVCGAGCISVLYSSSHVEWYVCVVYVVLVVFQCTPRCTAARTLSGMCVLCMWCWLYFSVLLAVQQLARWVVCVCCVCGAGCISVYSSLYSSSHVEWYVCVVYVVLVVFQCTPRCTAARTLSGMCVLCMWCWLYFSVLLAVQQLARWVVCVCVVYVVLVVFQCTPRCTAARTLSGMCVLCMWCWLYFSVLLAVQQLARWVVCVCCVCGAGCISVYSSLYSSSHVEWYVCVVCCRCTAARTLSGMCVLCMWCWLYFSVLLAVQQLARWVVCVCCVCGAGCISVYSSLYSSSHVEWYVCVVYVVLVVFQCTPRCTAARTLSGMCVLCMWCWLYFSVLLAVQQLARWVVCVCCVCGAGCISVYSSLYSSSHVEWYVCVVYVVLVVFQCTPRCTAARTLSGMCVLCMWCWLYFSVLLAVQQLARWVVCVCCVCGAGCISVYSSLYSSSHVDVCVVYVVLVVFQCTPRCTAARTLSGMCVLCMWCWLYFSVLLAVQQHVVNRRGGRALPVRHLPRGRHHRPHQHADRHDEPHLRGHPGENFGAVAEYHGCPVLMTVYSIFLMIFMFQIVLIFSLFQYCFLTHHPLLESVWLLCMYLIDWLRYGMKIILHHTLWCMLLAPCRLNVFGYRLCCIRCALETD